jgi:hypothetical protein
VEIAGIFAILGVGSKMSSIPTGVPELDGHAEDLGFLVGKTNIVLGKPSTGRSTVMMAAVAAAAKKGLQIYWADWACTRKAFGPNVSFFSEPTCEDLAAAFERPYDLFAFDGYHLLPGHVQVKLPRGKTMIFTWKHYQDPDSTNDGTQTVSDWWEAPDIGQVVILTRDRECNPIAHVHRNRRHLVSVEFEITTLRFDLEYTQK